MLRLCVTAYWLALTIWLGVLIAAGATAIAAFGTLPELGVAFPQAEGVYPAGSAEAGRFTAGFVAQPVFDLAARVMWFCVPVAAATALLLRVNLRFPSRSWPDRVRVAALTAAVLLALIHVLVLAPRMRVALGDYRSAVFQGDAVAAAAHKATFDADHRRSDPLLRTTGILLFGVIVLSAYTFSPRRAARNDQSGGGAGGRGFGRG